MEIQELEPILAEIQHVNDLGKSKWYEVVYYLAGQWRAYNSQTFQDGEQVVRWMYCKDLILPIHPNEVTNTQREKSDNDAKDNGFQS